MFDLDLIGASIPETTYKSFIKDDDPTRFEHWYPVVEALDIPRPDTILIDLPIGLYGVIVGDPMPGAEMSEEKGHEVMADIVTQVREFGKRVGYPLFVRNSYTSNKHCWDESCFIPEGMSDKEIITNISNLCHFNAMMMPYLGLKLVVRSFIDTKPVFHAFDHNMPITEEYRFFYRDGEPVFWQPYWPIDAFKNQKTYIKSSEGDASDKSDVNNTTDIDQEEVGYWLSTISTPSDELMATMMTHAHAVTRDLGGFWSVDFLIDRNGEPHLIDMALGNQSYQSEDKRDFT